MQKHEEQLLKAALWYREKMGFSVIPIGQNKKCAIKKEEDGSGGWELYQKEKPSLEQIKEWWSGEYANCNVGIVTGEISNLTVVDVDSKNGSKVGFDAIRGITPDSMITPIAQSPSGGEHRYFLYEKGTRNRIGFIPDCDLRSEGGYIIAPPSFNGRGNYIWKQGFSIVEVPLIFLPEEYLNALSYSNSLYTIDYIEDGNKQQHGQQTTTSIFSEGNRDNSLFHLANFLVRGGMPTREIQQYLLFIGSRCNPPFPEKEIYTKVQSAVKRAEVNEKGLTQAVRDIITTTNGNITVTNLQHWVTNDNIPETRKKINVIIGRLENEGLVKKTGRRAGEYRIISQDHEIQDWKNASIERVKVVLPLGMHEAVRISPGSIIMISGVTNTGKTSFGMNIARWNCGKEPVTYLTSEIEQDEFRSRVGNYCRENHDTIDRWDVELIAKFHPEALPDLINPDGLNIIDYLEPPNGDFTQIAPLITEIHHSLGKGIAVIAVQKKKGDEYGSGGQFIRNKTHLFCTLDVINYPVCRLKITKCKAPVYGYRNPEGLECDYKIGIKDGLTIIRLGKLPFSRWDREDKDGNIEDV